MELRLKTLTLSVTGLAIVLSAAGASFDWYIKRDDEKLKKQVSMLAAFDIPDNFRIMYRVSDIPKSVQTIFANAIQESDQEDLFLMAEPGAWPWNVGDAIIDGLPRRRLIAVALSESHCIVYYEHGGRAKSNDVAVFRLSDNGARAIWHSSRTQIANPGDLRGAIRAEPHGDGGY
jgi:hypothetical protein